MRLLKYIYVSYNVMQNSNNWHWWWCGGFGDMVVSVKSYIFTSNIESTHSHERLRFNYVCMMF